MSLFEQITSAATNLVISTRHTKPVSANDPRQKQARIEDSKQGPDVQSMYPSDINQALLESLAGKKKSA
jgi:hypothetical protein